ncbi:MAG: hypothetical protein O4861_24180 [Trichodesmium sp. St16_bin4-tuft]|nr:hypothetical protein [Trichodesmium sp. St5_bin8]MDE5079386.1 hypothetical protein [Trichodesmium sp. St2_bin6]MDE5092281.1 hypothetical protein [Trichodesmium sp. St18_bin3_1_1]MDE5101256.1 hypothetical protein [Trichodesmium sp. St16_bin4-tuft]MDE5101940.1 hypothetical protein [Trichodesmium sp. St19_bin2]
MATMESFSLIDTIVKELEKDVDLMRIKKVIYWACDNVWEDNETKLERVNMKKLIEKLYNQIENIESLNARLCEIVSKVNKKTEYSLLAQKIINSIGKLYPQEEETTVMEYIPNRSLTVLDDQIVLTNKLVVEESYPRDPGELFDVREKIMQGTNPLKAKILIFSAVQHQFDFGNKDWLLLRTKNLDSLLRQIFNLCLSITDLESSLYATANNFEDPDEYTQVADIVIKALNLCYSDEIIVPQSQAEAEKFETSILDTKKINMEDNSYFDKDDMTLLNLTNLPAINSTDKISFTPEEYPIIYSEKTNAYKDTIIDETTNKADKKTLENSLIYNQEIVPISQEKKPAIGGKNILDSIKQKLRIEDKISTIVNKKVDVVMDAIEAEFISLEKTLNHFLQGETEKKRLLLKYTALGNLISNIQEKYTKYQEILKELEKEERKKLNLNNSANTISQKSYKQTKIYDENQQKIIELATQGNPKAIAMIINQLLEQKGITAIAGRKNDYIHIVLESEQVPNPEIVTPLVEQKIASLQSKYLKNVKIHGRQLGNKSVIWTKTISL